MSIPPRLFCLFGGTRHPPARSGGASIARFRPDAKGPTRLTFGSNRQVGSAPPGTNRIESPAGKNAELLCGLDQTESSVINDNIFRAIFPVARDRSIPSRGISVSAFSQHLSPEFIILHGALYENSFIHE
jgi:hypothetical protein